MDAHEVRRDLEVNNGNALTGSGYTSGSVNYGTTIVAPSNPTKDATTQYTYTFAGWYTAAEGGTEVTDFGTITGDVTYYAHWIQGDIVTYNLWIGDTEFTSACLTIAGKSGTATLNPEDFTLTLNNFSLTAPAPKLKDGYASGLITYIITSTDQPDLTIELTDKNHIENTYAEGYGSGSYGIYIWGDANLTFTGDGSLTCIGGRNTGYDNTESSMSSGICFTNSSSKMTVNIGGTLTAKGIFCSNVVVNSGTVEAIAETADKNTDTTYGSYGLYGSATLYNGATLTAQGETRAIYADNAGTHGTSVTVTAPTGGTTQLP